MKNSLLLKEAQAKGLKIGHTDIETSLKSIVMYGDTLHYVDPKQIIMPTQITSIAWVNDKSDNVLIDEWDRPKSIKDVFTNLRKDYKMLKRVIPKLNNFDFIIGQNIKEFDKKKIQFRCCYYGLPKIQNLICLDTLQLSRNNLSPDSHKLDHKSRMYGYGGKIPQGMEDAIKVFYGDKVTSKVRCVYNKKDVLDTKKMFWKEIDYEELPKNLIQLLRLYIKYDEPTFCRKCEYNKEAKFDVRRFVSQKKIRFICNRCEYKWEIAR